MCVKSLQLCLTLCDPMECSLPGSSVHGILQEHWSGLPCSHQGIFLTQRSNQGLLSLLHWQAQAYAIRQFSENWNWLINHQKICLALLITDNHRYAMKTTMRCYCQVLTSVWRDGCSHKLLVRKTNWVIFQESRIYEIYALNT